MYFHLQRMFLVTAVAFAVFAGCCEETETKLIECEASAQAAAQELISMRSQVKDFKSLEAKRDVAEEELAETKSIMAKMEEKEALANKRIETMRGLLDKLKGAIEAGDLLVRIKRGKMVLELPSAILFKSGEADLSEKGQNTLDEIATVLKEIPGREFQVAGHTDNVPVSEDNPHGTNWHLSTARAVSVVLYLKEAGVKPRNLSAAGYAQYRPAASNKSKRGKKRNRRIEITLMPNLSELPDLSALEKEFNLADLEQADLPVLSY